jgi:LysM repeat protein
MISPDLTEIGAGVSVNNGKVYFVIDCARPTNSGVPQVLGTSVVGASTDPTSRGIPIPVAMATPNADGDIIHEVKEGQTLWQIAISYNTTIDEIKRLNNLFDNNIYPVTKLLIRKTVTLTPTLPVDYPTIEMASSPAQNPTVTVTALGATLTSTPLNPSLPASANNLIGIVIGILAVAILGGGIIAWLGSAKK